MHVADENIARRRPSVISIAAGDETVNVHCTNVRPFTPESRRLFVSSPKFRRYLRGVDRSFTVNVLKGKMDWSFGRSCTLVLHCQKSWLSETHFRSFGLSAAAQCFHMCGTVLVRSRDHHLA